MTLKEKFHQWLKTDPFGSKDRVTLREAQCEVIAEEFAIEFAEWLIDGHVSKLTLEEFKKQKEKENELFDERLAEKIKEEKEKLLKVTPFNYCGIASQLIKYLK